MLARALYSQTDAAAGLAAIGLPEELAEHFEAPSIDVWPEHWQVLEIFSALATQWRVGMSGATGIDYAAIPPVLDWYRVPEAERSEMFFCLRVMEREALAVMSERRSH